jgi:L-amino acid N-acyltransferase YncA
MVTSKIRNAVAEDAGSIAAIYNAGIAERVATFETVPRTERDMAERIASHPRHPVLVTDRGGAIVGWAGIGSYRPRACYDGVAEFSICIDPAARGQGVGGDLCRRLSKRRCIPGERRTSSGVAARRCRTPGGDDDQGNDIR